MIPVGLHADDIPVILSAGIIQCSEDRLSEVAQKERLAVFRDKDQMCHEQVLVVPAVLVTVHISPLEQLYCATNFCYNVFGDIILRKGDPTMAEYVKTMKLMIHPEEDERVLLAELTKVYAAACNRISEYIFDHGFPLNFMKVQDAMYNEIRISFGLKAQMTISAFKTVTARYKTVKEQLFNDPYKYQDEDGQWQYVTRTLEWLMKPVRFHRPQADLVRGRDYSFVTDKRTGEKLLSLNTLEKRIRVPYEVPENFSDYFDGTWSFGTGKIVSLNGNWYFHIPMTKEAPGSRTETMPSHVVGIDRGLRFLVTAYDETGKTTFISGKKVLEKREHFAQVRAQLQSKGTKSAKRALKRISGRENRWMTDVNHQVSKTLTDMYGANTLFVIEDLSGVSFDKKNLDRGSKGNGELRSWSFYQLEQFLTYKAIGAGSIVLKVKADYTSQRCPKCGRIFKENRHHDTHEYICDCCGYRSNDDRVGAMNIQLLGTMYVSGDAHPRFGVRKTE